MSTIILKKCSKCEEEKELNQFRKCSAAKFGVKNFCRICDDKYQKERYIRKKPEIMEQVLEWQAENVDKVKQYKKDWFVKEQEKQKVLSPADL